jgi:hypothetical protein
MRALLTKRWISALKVTACVLVIMACQLPCLATQTVGVPPAPAGDGGSTPEPTPVDIVFGSGPFDLMDPAVGLANLSSYQATLTISFTGTQAGQPSQDSHTYVMLTNRESSARQITVDAVNGNPAIFFKAEANGVSYELLDDGTCIGSPLAAGASLATEWEPAGFLPGLIGAEAAGSETVNGFASDKYTFDEHALGESGFTQSTGQVWVDPEHGVVVSYLLTTTAGADYFGEGVEGSRTWEYNLTDIDQPVSIELPAGCPGGLVDAPLLPSAQNVDRQPGVTTYLASGSLQDVLAFYQEQLPSLGWTATTEPVVNETMGTAMFEKNGLQLVVMVTPADNGVEVHLMVASAPVPTP